METVYYVYIGENEMGPFHTQEAAKAEAKALKARGYTVTIKGKKISSSRLVEMFGEVEEDIDLDDDDDTGADSSDETEGDETDDDGTDIDSLFSDDDDDEKAKAKPKARTKVKDETDSEAPRTKDKAPQTDSFWFRTKKKEDTA